MTPKFGILQLVVVYGSGNISHEIIPQGSISLLINEN